MIRVRHPSGRTGEGVHTECWKNETPPVDHLIHESLREGIAEILAALSPQQAKIISLRYGLEDGTEHTLEEIGQRFSVTPGVRRR